MARKTIVIFASAWFALTACKTPLGRQAAVVHVQQPRVSAPVLTKLAADTQPKDAPLLVASSGAFFDIGAGIDAADLVFERRSGRLYAASISGGIHASDDQGKSWKSLRAQGSCRQVVPETLGNLYAICDDKLIVRDSGSDVWRSLPLPRGATQTIIPEQLAVSPARPQRLYLAGRGEADHNGLFRTEDDGKTWLGIESITLLDDDGSTLRIAPVDEMVRGFAVHPTNPDFIVALLTYGVFLSTDGGANFVRAGLLKHAPSLPPYGENTTTSAQASRVFFDATDPKTAYVLSPDGFEVTRDAGVSWRTHRHNEPLSRFVAHPRVGGALYAQTASRTMLVSKSYGDLWQAVAPVEVPDAERTFFPGWKTLIAPVPGSLVQMDAPLAVSPSTGRVFGGGGRGILVFVGVGSVE